MGIYTTIVRSDFRSPLGRAIRTPLRLVPRSMPMPVLSGLNVGMRWLAGAHTHACWLGHYEEEKQALLRALVRRGMTAYDIGAQAGFFTLALHRLVGSEGKVFAFEPEADNVRRLRRHISLNALHNAVVIQAAISDRCDLTRFHSASAMSKIAEESAYLVPSMTLDDFVAKGFPHPDIVKLDIEGAEVSALKGASSIINRRETTWIIDTHGDDLFAQCADALRFAGYQVTTANNVDAGANIVAVPGKVSEAR